MTYTLAILLLAGVIGSVLMAAIAVAAWIWAGQHRGKVSIAGKRQRR